MLPVKAEKNLNEQDRVAFIGTKSSWCFQTKILRCFTPQHTCMLKEETADHFVRTCLIFEILRAIWQTKSTEMSLTEKRMTGRMQ